MNITGFEAGANAVNRYTPSKGSLFFKYGVLCFQRISFFFLSLYKSSPEAMTSRLAARVRLPERKEK